MAHGALGNPGPLLLARRLAESAVEDFWDAESGTFRDTSNEHDRTVAQPRGMVDNATPAANSLAADVLQRMALLTGEVSYARRADAILRAIAPALDRQPSAFGRMLAAADRRLGEPIDVVVAAVTPGDGLALRRAASRPYVPDLVLTSVAPGDPQASWPLYVRKEPREGRATAFACRGYACDEPTHDAGRLAEQVVALSPAQPGR